jgi:DNA-binding response OmpR family regulator
MERRALAGRRILVVEDQAILAAEVEMLLEQLGCEVVGPAATLSQALELARGEPLDGAILDINLHGEAVYPVADLLRSRQIPFLLATGYSAENLPDRFVDCPILEKPFVFEELEERANALWTPSVH